MDREPGKKAEPAAGPATAVDGRAAEGPALSIDSYVPTLIARLALRLIKSAQEPFKAHNLTIAKFRILLTLTEHPGVRFKRLAQLTRIEAPTLSRVLDGMEADGHIRRRRNREDSRSVEIHPTAAGRALFDAAIPWSVATERKLLRKLSEAEQRQLVELLNRMHRSLDEDDGIAED